MTPPLEKRPETPDEKATAEERDTVRIYLWFGVGIVAGGLGVYFWLLLFRVNSQPNFGQVGDAMAPFTALLSAAALFAAVEGVRLQSKELKLQRDELEAQRKEIADSRKVMQEQADAATETAKVQKQLVKAQKALAEAQREANKLAARRQDITLAVEKIRLELEVANLDADRKAARRVDSQENFERLRNTYVNAQERLRSARLGGTPNDKAS